MRRHTAFSFLDSGVTKAGTTKYSAIGECSYKLFLDLGGDQKVPGKTPFNGFAVSYLVFPGGQTAAAQLPLMGQAENAWELPLLIAYGGEKGRAITGEAGDKRLEAARKKGASGMLGSLPPNYDTVVAALSAHGFPGDPLALSRGRRDPTTPVLHLGDLSGA
jgi:hypothetical protein